MKLRTFVRMFVFLHLCLAVICARADVLMHDTFTTGVDQYSYVLLPPVSVELENDNLLMVPQLNIPASELPTLRRDFSGDLQAEVQFRIDNIARVLPQVREASCGFRMFEGGNSLTAEVFMHRMGVEEDMLVMRRTNPFEEGTTKALSRQVKPGELFTIRQSFEDNNVSASVQSAAGELLAELQTPLPSNVEKKGGFRIVQYNLPRVVVTSANLTDSATSSVVLAEGFNGPTLNSAIWPTNAIVQGEAFDTENGRLRLRPKGKGTARLPLQKRFRDFDFKATAYFTEVKNPAGYFAVNFRMGNLESGIYQLAVFPLAGHQVERVRTPCFALRKKESATQYTYLCPPQPIVTPAKDKPANLHIRAIGNSIKAAVGIGTGSAAGQVCSAVNYSLAEGMIEFMCTDQPMVEVEEYTIWSGGTGDLPPQMNNP